MKALIPTCDRKTKYWTNQQNTYGLLPGPSRYGSCPYATLKEGGCWYKPKGRKRATCYVDKLLGCYPGVERILQHNTRLMKAACLKGPLKVRDILVEEFLRFLTCEAKRSQKAGKPIGQPYYRLHWSGDIFSAQYAKGLALAMQTVPQLQFWCYTRSFPYVKYLKDVQNLKLYLSLDSVNYNKGLQCWHANPWCRIAHMSHHEPAVPGVMLTPCPVDGGKLALEYGCSKCGLCPNGRANVWFES